MKRLMIGLVRFYQRFISPLLPPVCRFQPTCSHYAISSLERFGFFRGSLLALWRILRCHPCSRGGYDPVPEYFWTTDRTSLSELIKQSSRSDSQQPRRKL